MISCGRGTTATSTRCSRMHSCSAARCASVRAAGDAIGARLLRLRRAQRRLHVGSLRGEVYGGRSLARGLREPENEALRPLDDFFLDKSVVLLGGSVGARLFGVDADARYQREILSDRSSLVSERASLDFPPCCPGSG